jgi:class II lanthipeptide synthase
MDAFFERLMVRAATIDELLSDDFEPVPGEKSDADLAARRLAAWRQSCANGDQSLFERRLQRDGWNVTRVVSRFSAVNRKASAQRPAWIDDAIWIESAIQQPGREPLPARAPSDPCAFEDLFTSVVAKANNILCSGISGQALDNLSDATCLNLRSTLLHELSTLAAPALYERFSKIRQTAAAEWAPPAKSTNTLYDRFIADMRSGGLRALFEEKPVLLRLLATLTRQWIDTSRELIVRLDADLPVLREKILHQSIRSRVAKIEGSLSDPHNAGHSTQIIEFEDGSRVVYKPKDLRLDVAWHALIERLNRAEAPVRLRAVGTIARDGYGWTEFVDHAGTDADGCRHYFQRAGAWLALFHLFAANDMHQENMIATDDHPVPIDLETILQAPSAGHKREIPEAQAQEAALESIANS